MADSAVKLNKKKLLLWGLALVLALGCAAVLLYFWRVFYSYGQYPIPRLNTALVAAGLAGLAVLGVGAAFCICHFVKSFSMRAAATVFCVGLLFVFVNPPLQVPDETQHFLRAYAVSMGRLDCDVTRGYPEDVQMLTSSFNTAWTSAHDGAPLKVRYLPEQDPATLAPEETFHGEGVLYCFETYANYRNGVYMLDPAAAPTEPVLFMWLPLIPQAVGILFARLLGFSALGALYGGRIGALAVYTLLCYAALKNCRRYRPLFLMVMLLPLSLFMAASCSYDSLLLGLYLFAASYFCKDEITARDIVLFSLALALMANVKLHNLLWLALPLVLPKKAWRAGKMKKWHAAAMILVATAALWLLVTLYNSVALNGYAETERMMQGVDQGAQLQFMLHEPLRTLAVFFGTLVENDFFLFRLGVFGNVDLTIPLINTFAALGLLLGAALSVHQKSSLSARSVIGLCGLAALYTGSMLAGLYITYTPVSMVRVIGLQARYFLPVFLMLGIALAGLLSHVLAPSDEGRGTAKAVELGYRLAAAGGVLGALLLFQTYFIGPVSVVQYAL